jgi:hypothetical protein
LILFLDFVSWVLVFGFGVAVGFGFVVALGFAVVVGFGDGVQGKGDPFPCTSTLRKT